MFRKPAINKRRSKLPSSAVDNDDDDDDNEQEWRKAQSISLPQKQTQFTTNVENHDDNDSEKVGSKRRIIRSFDVDPDGDDEDERLENAELNLARKQKERKVRKKRGLGFGGGSSEADRIRVGQTAPFGSTVAVDEEEAENDLLESFNRYDQEALSKLQSEQAAYVVPTVERAERAEIDEGIAQSGASTETSAAPIALDLMADTLNQNPDEPFLPTENTILTGDEAFTVDSNEQTARQLNDDEELDYELGDDATFWEEQVARRAGVNARPVRTANTRSVPVSLPPTEKVSHKYLSTDQLRSQISLTLELMQIQHDDSKSTLLRRQAEKSLAQNDQLDHHRLELEKVGTAVEYYQVLRQRLANWVGALRQLQTKISPILTAMHELEAEMAGIANALPMNWENDMIAVLHQHHLLKQVIGRQPDASVYEQADIDQTVVDEFGRAVKPQNVLQREKRVQHRQRIRQQRKVRQGMSEATLIASITNDHVWQGDESDAWLSEDEQESLRQRRKALIEALQMALNEPDDEYTGLHRLVKLFEDWHTTFPDDYKECFASLSLADLCSVLIQAELCSLNDPWDHSAGHNEGIWITMAHSAKESGVLDNAGLERILERAVLPVFVDLLDRKAYNIMSTQQTKRISQFWKHLQKIVLEAPLNSSSALDLQSMSGKMIDYIKSFLDSFAIPILVKETLSNENSLVPISEDLQEALDGATNGQMQRIKKVLLNIITYWVPILPFKILPLTVFTEKQISGGNELIRVVLDFCSTKLLYLLSSLKGIPQRFGADFTADVYQTIWNALLPLGWLDKPEWMLQAAPLRVAASLY